MNKTSQSFNRKRDPPVWRSAAPNARLPRDHTAINVTHTAIKENRC
jgi:hypothetical protein